MAPTHLDRQSTTFGAKEGCGVLVSFWDSNSDFGTNKLETRTLGPKSDSNSMTYCVT